MSNGQRSSRSPGYISPIFFNFPLNYKGYLLCSLYDPTFGRTRRQDIYLWQTLLYTLQVAVGYMLMLTVMTYNTWLGVAVLAGVGTGYLAFSVVFPDHLIFRTTHREGLLLEGLSHRNMYPA